MDKNVNNFKLTPHRKKIIKDSAENKDIKGAHREGPFRGLINYFNRDSDKAKYKEIDRYYFKIRVQNTPRNVFLNDINLYQIIFSYLNFCYVKDFAYLSIRTLHIYQISLPSIQKYRQNLSKKYTLQYKLSLFLPTSDNPLGFKDSQLTHLDLSYFFTKVTDDDLDFIAKNFPNLTHLNLRSCKHTSHTGRALLATLKRLTSLNLGYIKNLTNDDLKLIAENFPNLTSLHLCGLFSEDRLTQLRKALPNLKIIRGEFLAVFL